MRRNLLVLVVLEMVLAGCGGQPEPAPAGFVNQTHHSDTELWTIWKAAQETLAQEVDLNPLQRSFSGAPADIRPGDPRALKIDASPTKRNRRARCFFRNVSCGDRRRTGRSNRDDRLPETL